MVMKAAIYREFGARVAVEDLPDPAPAPDGVVVGIMATGVCRSDWHGWQGHDPDIQLPHVPGHELAGVVEAVGSDVRQWQAGDRVTVPFCGGCGVCAQCTSGNQHICDNHFQPGFTAWGSFAELCSIRYADINLVRLPDEMNFETAASLGCRFITAYRAVRDQGRVSAEQWMAVHGCGGVGLSAVMIGNALGARVIAVDISDAALSLAGEFGAEHTINASAVGDESSPDVAAMIREISSGGAHLSLDAVGSAETASNSVLCLRKQGRHVQIGLLPGEGTSMPMVQVIAREIEIVGSHGMQAHRYPGMLDMIAAGQLQPQRLITQIIALEDAPQALEGLGSFSSTGITVINRFS